MKRGIGKVAILFLIALCLPLAVAASITCPGVVTTDTTLTDDVVDSFTGSNCIDLNNNNIVLNCQGHSISSTSSQGVAIVSGSHTGLTVKNCNIRDVTWPAWFQSATDVLFTNTSWRNTSNPIGFKTSTNVRIINVSCAEVNGGGCIFFEDSDIGLIDNSRLATPSYTGMEFNNTKHVNITNNKFNNIGQSAIWLYRGSNDFIIKNNAIDTNSMLYGMDIEGSNNTWIENNSITNVIGSAIYTYYSNYTALRSNTIVNTNYDYIYLYHGIGMSIDGGYMDGGGYHGIEAIGTPGITIKNVRVGGLDLGHWDIILDNFDNGLVQGSNFTTSQFGIDVEYDTPATSNITIRDCRFDGMRTGIQCDRAVDLTILNNSMHGFVEEPILLFGPVHATVSFNNVSDVETYNGIELQGATNSLVEGNIVQNVSGSCIGFWRYTTTNTRSSDNTVRMNSMRDCDYGIDNEQSDNITWESNQVQNTKDNAIYLWDADSVILRNVTVSGTQDLDEGDFGTGAVYHDTVSNSKFINLTFTSSAANVWNHVSGTGNTWQDIVITNASTGFNFTAGSSLDVNGVTFTSVGIPISSGAGASSVTFEGLALSSTDAKLSYPGSIDFSGPYTLNSGYTFSPLSVYVDSAARPKLNTSAHLLVNGVTFANPRVIVDTGSGWTVCSSPLCSNKVFNSGAHTVNFDVQHFSNFSIEDTPAEVAVPEFGTWALLVGLCITIAGVYYIRKE